jgi:succinate dehydrogenase flavin-adding protein (antitoxin of CptAB toxin-antitoxin module)
MVAFNELYEQNHKIAELSKVILYMIQDRSICDTEITCSLFFNYVNEVKNHLDREERELYKNLLTHSDVDVKNTATKYLSGSADLKRVFKGYIKRWCHNNQLRIKDHEQFISDTKDMFEMVQERAIDESENFYPLVRDVATSQAVVY